MPMGMRLGIGLLVLVVAGESLPPQTTPTKQTTPLLVGHRGLIHHAPENTVQGFAACFDLAIGIELDVRRTRDGHLVCLHDDDVKRTTDGTGKVAELSLADLQKLDAGRWFDPAFAGLVVPTLEEVFRLCAGERASSQVLIAIDLKIDDETVEADVVRLAEKHGVLDQLVFIGRAIETPSVRRKLRAANPKVSVAVLAQTADDLPAALKDRDSNWAYLRFVPTAEQVAQVHRAGKRVFLVGPTVSGREPDNWRRAREAGVDAILTDFPLECRQVFRESQGGTQAQAKAKPQPRARIDQGTPKSGHWAFVKPERPPVPVSRDIVGRSWVRNPIDAFILARLEREGLKPSPEADRITLLRRLSLDLIGLPPPIAEVDAFLADQSPDAYQRQVERLLRSPHYGERWGRHWLDAARYADSDGYEKDKQRQVWAYRDWVVNALNRDLPYDRFIIEQLAGDLLV
jgi:glycerophosphoryl diester phosphodiesterase